MSINYGDDYQYAGEKLVDSYVYKDGYPVLIHDIDFKGKVAYIKMGGDRVENCRLEDLNLSALKLGYVNFPLDALYVVRKPQRVFRQGVRQGSCVVKAGKNFNRMVPFNAMIAQNITGLYPSFGDCMDYVGCGDVNSKAFSRKFALKGSARSREQCNLFLMYRDVKVGNVTFDQAIKLDEKFKYLQESLNEVLN